MLGSSVSLVITWKLPMLRLSLPIAAAVVVAYCLIYRTDAFKCHICKPSARSTETRTFSDMSKDFAEAAYAIIPECEESEDYETECAEQSVCFKLTKQSDGSTLMKGCATSDSKEICEDLKGSGKVCSHICSSELCNSAHVLFPNLWLVISATSLLVLQNFYFM